MPKPTKIYEVLDTVANAKTANDRIAVLRSNNSLGLRDVLRAAFDPAIVFTLPTGLPTYQADLSKDGFSATDLMRSTKQFTYFVKGGAGDKLSSLKRESLFLRLLEGIHPRDAEIVCLIKEKKLESKYPTITTELVKATWPTLIL